MRMELGTINSRSCSHRVEMCLFHDWSEIMSSYKFTLVALGRDRKTK